MAVDSVTAACHDVARDHIEALCPGGTLRVCTEQAIECHGRRDWVTDAIHDPKQEFHRRVDAMDMPPASLPSRRRDVAAEHLLVACPGGSATVTGDTVARAVNQRVTDGPGTGRHMAGQGWVLRALESQERGSLERVRQENREARELSEFMSRTRGLPADGHGGWYECEMPCDVGHAIALARHHPDDRRAQETTCQVIAKTPSVPQHLEAERAQVVVDAMRGHAASGRLQWRASQALMHITGSVAAARTAEAAGAVDALTAGALRHPGEKALQEAALAALANIAKHREKVFPLGFDLCQTVDAAKSAMGNYPVESGIQCNACMLLWNLAMENPGLLATHPGLRNLVEHAAGMGVREARWLLECVQWRTAAEVDATRGGGRRRWGQWATGRLVAA
mmetsp:Transcript_110762/g.313377  ORF Transcript_110762/g.313377 Transcript_110762/m.313377 type:complete len:394 (+) Transcript_110762:114-1295(+)